MPKSQTEIMLRLSGMLTELEDADYDSAGITDGDGFVLAYAEMVEQLNLLSEQSRSLYERDEQGEYVPMSRSDYDAVMESYRKSIEACQKFVSFIPARSSAAAPANELIQLLSGDQSLLKTINPAAGLSLPEAVSAARTVYIDVPVDRGANEGGARSSRMPVEIKREDGHVSKGFFSKESAYCFDDEYDKVMTAAYAGATSRSERELITTLRSAESRGRYFSEMVNYLDPSNAAERKRTGMSSIELYMTKSGVNAPYPRSENWRSMIRGLAKLGNKAICFNTLVGQPSDMSILVQERNCAMYSLSKLFGVPDVIAPAEKMCMTIGGNAVDGIMMETAAGVDPQKIPADHVLRDRSVSKSEIFTGEAFKSMASLQIMDYICLNTDRHGNNFTMVFDGDKMVGVQGFDNDASFGPKVPKTDERISHLTALDDMLVIPEGLARTIEQMDKAMLDTVMSGYLMDHETVDAIWDRVSVLQERIREGREFYKDKPEVNINVGGHLRVVADSEWNSLTINGLKGYVDDYNIAKTFAQRKDFTEEQRLDALDSLRAGNQTRNIFFWANDNIQFCRKPNYRQLSETQYSAAKSISGYDEFISTLGSKLKTMHESMKSVDPFYLVNSSPQFGDMKDKVGDICTLLENGLGENKLENCETVLDALQELSALAKEYKKYKINDRKVNDPQAADSYKLKAGRETTRFELAESAEALVSLSTSMLIDMANGFNDDAAEREEAVRRGVERKNNTLQYQESLKQSIDSLEKQGGDKNLQHAQFANLTLSAHATLCTMAAKSKLDPAEVGMARKMLAFVMCYQQAEQADAYGRSDDERIAEVERVSESEAFKSATKHISSRTIREALSVGGITALTDSYVHEMTVLREKEALRTAINAARRSADQQPERNDPAVN